MLDTKSENEAFGIFLRITNRKIRILPEGTLGCPPCRRFRSGVPVAGSAALCCPPCRRFRSSDRRSCTRRSRCPPCRRFRRPSLIRENGGYRCPPCRRFRSSLVITSREGACCPPCRRFRRVVEPALPFRTDTVARRAGGMVPVFSFSLPMRTARFSGLFFGSGPAEGAPVQEEGARPAHSGHLRLSSFALASTSSPGCGEPYPRAAARHSASSIGEACL